MALEAIGGLESSAKPSERPRRFPCFDGFRALAAMGVLVNHVALISGINARQIGLGHYLARLDVGVAVFFLISGFLLYRPFVAARLARRSAPATKPFLWRRALRIFPAYWAALTVVAVIFKTDTIHGTAGWFLHYGLLQIYSPGRVTGGPVQQAWTLAVEISFYAFLPAYAWLIARFVGRARDPLRVELAGVAVLYLISVVWRLAMFATVHGDKSLSMVLTWMPAFFDLFALGMGLAVLSVHRQQRAEADGGTDAPFGLGRPGAPAVCWALAALSFWAVSTRIGLFAAPIRFSTWQEMARQFLYGTTAFFLLLPGIFGPQEQGLIRRFLRNRVVQLTGVISYGIYLFHEFWIDIYIRDTHMVAFFGDFWRLLGFDLVLTVVTAIVCYVVVERPALMLKDRSRWDMFPGRRGRALAAGEKLRRHDGRPL